MSFNVLNDAALNQLFRDARTVHAFKDTPVSDAVIHQLYDLLKWCPTAFNAQPARYVFLKTAEAKGKRAFGWDSDMTAYGPKAHLASSVINWAPYYIKATREALEGKWTGGTGVWWGVKEGAIDIVSIAEDVPADTKAKIDEIKAGLKDGSFAIWKGPLVDNTGKTLLKKDEVADDKFLSGVNFYVKGVEGKVPGNK